MEIELRLVNSDLTWCAAKQRQLDATTIGLIRLWKKRKKKRYEEIGVVWDSGVSGAELSQICDGRYGVRRLV